MLPEDDRDSDRDSGTKRIRGHLRCRRSLSLSNARLERGQGQGSDRERNETSRPGSAGAIKMFALLLAMVAGCAFPMAGGMDSSQTLEIMKAQNARGCLFIRGSATPWASAGFMAIGTWGTDPPPYKECFSGIPVIP